MKEIGNFLKNAREEKGISLDEISNATKIPKRHLRSLEEGNFSCFPGEVYLRGALRNYAEMIGLNPREVLSGYELLLKKNKTMENERKDVKKHKTKQLKGDNEPLVFKNKRKPLPLAAFVWIVLLAIVVGGSLWYLFQQPASEDPEPPYTVEPAPEENGREEDNGLNPPEETLPVKPEITVVNSGGNEAVYLLSGAEQKQVVMNFSGRCWVRIEQEGRLVEEANYANGDRRELGDALETRIRLGYPAAVEIRVNGIELEGLAGTGNPMDITIRKEN